VLVVTPDPATRAALLGWLRDDGYAAVGFASFHDARRAIRAAHPELLVVEARLGVFSGLHLVQSLHGDERVPHAIVLTRHDNPGAAEEAARLGAESLQLPMSRDTFAATVARILPQPR
jgi:DNA-binding NtrC family response regulator